jgi:hypothetical protein
MGTLALPAKPGPPAMNTFMGIPIIDTIYKLFHFYKVS